ncbi:major histocompatibility complex class I-related gene protein-like isoform X2 [Corythoichthys intestinalis]|uniref:major histocompatibility complex class I-related gene protein-like isoform X2 n=1 Tax=Corythoichthys intestinalis TaxID=161448 RepID=UPI0025A626D4|nr:major histocompatibility complex class I-related gene protein-like isoform X2 [Corythoichthys intestinalis]
MLHSLRYCITASTQINNRPDILYDIYVDGVLILHYDNNNRKVELRYDFVNEAIANDPILNHLGDFAAERETLAKTLMEKIRIADNITEGVHCGQLTFGCKWNAENEETDGWERYSYDGEDYASLDVATESWTIANRKSRQYFIATLNLEHDEGPRKYRKYFYTEKCLSQLKTFLEYGQDFYKRAELPKVSLLQKTPSSPITCHATGFYPNTADLFWRKDGEQLHMDADYGEILPNHDRTFQMTANLKVNVTAEVEGHYECVFQLSGVKDDIVIKLDERKILSNLRIENEKQKKVAIATAVPLAVLGLVVIIVAVVFVKCRKRIPGDYAPPPVEMSNSERARENGNTMGSEI